MKFFLLILFISLPLSTQAYIPPDSLKFSPPAPPPLKSEAFAYGLAASITLLTFVAAIDGTSGSIAGEIVFPLICPIVGPSLGQLYAGSWWQPLLGASIRTVGLSILLAAFLGTAQCDQDCGDHGDVLPTGLAILGVGTVYSFVDTHFAVKRANERIREKARHKQTFTSFELFPTLTRTPDNSQRVGMVASMRF